MTTVVTVGYDGSVPSHHAVTWAAAKAARRHAGLRMVSCYSMPVVVDPWIGAYAVDLRTIEEAARTDLDRVAQHVARQHPDLPIEQCVVHGPASEQLIEHAGPTLLVVGTTGAGAAQSFLLGSVAHAVARHAPCPVALIPDAAQHVPTHRVVVGVDGSAASTTALRWATDEADLRDAELVVVHAWDYPYTIGVIEPEGRDFTRIDAALVLDQAVEAARERGRCPVRGELVEASPASALTDAADNADLVVVGTRGRGGFRSLLFGSVAHAVAQHASCPTVVVHA